MSDKRPVALLLIAGLLAAGPLRAADRLSVMLDWLPNPDEAPCPWPGTRASSPGTSSMSS